MLVDRYLARFEHTVVRELDVDAPAAVTWDAISETDLSQDTLVSKLTALRTFPDHIAHRLTGRPLPDEPQGRFTFRDLVQRDGPFVPLEKDPGCELVAGAIGKVWRPAIAWASYAPEQFAEFNEPGWAKIALSIRVTELGSGRSHIRYEARTGTTDRAAAWRFTAYWALMRPFAGFVMARALKLIRAQATAPQNRPTQAPPPRLVR